jgi:hypothetical protein
MRSFSVSLALALVVSLALVGGAAASNPSTGNLAPSGPHFTLNIHGVANGQGFNGNNQDDIFVPLTGHCSINLVEAATVDFSVLQPDCVNNPPASFELPAPCAISATTGLCTSTTTLYSVWVRALGTPGGSANITTCATDPANPTGPPVCSIGAFVAVVQRKTGKSTFTNVTSDLLFLTTCNLLTGKTTSTPIFSQNFQNFFWSYDNTGLRLAQLRFYQVPSNVPTSVTCP